MTQPTPADLLRAAAKILREEDWGTAPEIAKPLAAWLDQAAKSAEANVTAAYRVWANSDDTEARDKWIAEMTDQHAIAVARAVLGEVTE